MVNFLANYYGVFIALGIFLSLGLIGYWMDRKKYEQYRQEIVNEDRAYTAMVDAPDIQPVAESIPVNTNPANENQQM